ncbi:hypothetical protein AAZX31_15G138200 [Glycine max]
MAFSVSTICQSYLSMVALILVCRGVEKCVIPCVLRNVFNLMNSREFIKLKNFSTTTLNFGNIIKTSDLLFNMYNQVYFVK